MFVNAKNTVFLIIVLHSHYFELSIWVHYSLVRVIKFPLPNS